MFRCMAVSSSRAASLLTLNLSTDEEDKAQRGVMTNTLNFNPNLYDGYRYPSQRC